MKKSILALAVLGAFAGAAVAQSSVTLYGVVDANLSSAKGGSTTLTSMGSGGLQGNRWGMRGTEDMGGGLKANFVLESGFSLDDGAVAQSLGSTTYAVPPAANTSVTTPRLFGRAAWVSLGGGFGELRLGRQLTPIGSMSDGLGPLGSKGADLFTVARTVAAAGTGPAYRTDNAVTYLTPNLGGFTAQAQYSFRLNGAEAAGVNKNFGKHFGVSAAFKGGPFEAGVAYLDVKDFGEQNPNITVPPIPNAGNQKVKSLLAYGGFNFGFASIKVAYNQDDLSLAKDPKTIGVAVEAPLGPMSLGLGVAQAKDISGSATAGSDDALLLNVQAVYNMSKRTALYAFYTSVDNDSGAALGFNGPALDKRSSLLQIGVRHRF